MRDIAVEAGTSFGRWSYGARRRTA